MRKYQIGYYQKPSGEMPVKTYIKDKSPEDQGKIKRKQDQLEVKGPFLKMPSARKMGKIYELRPTGMRLFYYWRGKCAVFVHAVDKKDFTQADVSLAEKRRKELEGK